MFAENPVMNNLHKSADTSFLVWLEYMPSYTK